MVKWELKRALGVPHALHKNGVFVGEIYAQSLEIGQEMVDKLNMYEEMALALPRVSRHAREALGK